MKKSSLAWHNQTHRHSHTLTSRLIVVKTESMLISNTSLSYWGHLMDIKDTYNQIGDKYGHTRDTVSHIGDTSSHIWGKADSAKPGAALQTPQ